MLVLSTFFNILFAGYYSFLNFKMGDASYITKMFHEGHGYSVENFLKNEDWFYNTKKYSSNFLGLSIYEAENIKDLENYEDFSIKMWSIQDSEIDIFKYLQNIDYECIYNEKNQRLHTVKSVDKISNSKYKRQEVVSLYRKECDFNV